MRLSYFVTLGAVLVSLAQAAPSDPVAELAARDGLEAREVAALFERSEATLELEARVASAEAEAEAMAEASAETDANEAIRAFSLEARQAPGYRCPKGKRAVSKGVAVRPNGCGSGKIDVPEFGFGGCCNAHDRCYSNCGENKWGCDSKFLSCMINKCKSDFKWFDPRRGICTRAGQVYAGAVAAGGLPAFNSATKKHCKCV